MKKDFRKAIVFDMDGTIADLYGVEGWLADLRAERVRPYAEARPIYNMDELNEIISFLKGAGWNIVVTTWLAKGSTKDYDERVRKAKIDWLAEMGFDYDEIHLVKYGTTKANCTRKKYNYQVLVDDNEKVRKGWSLGKTINANENIFAELLKLIEEEY
jgi:FMN phosphatase YigB (HAD superfamily)